MPCHHGNILSLGMQMLLLATTVQKRLQQSFGLPLTFCSCQVLRAPPQQLG